MNALIHLLPCERSNTEFKFNSKYLYLRFDQYIFFLNFQKWLIQKVKREKSFDSMSCVKIIYTEGESKDDVHTNILIQFNSVAVFNDKTVFDYNYNDEFLKPTIIKYIISSEQFQQCISYFQGLSLRIGKENPCKVEPKELIYNWQKDLETKILDRDPIFNNSNIVWVYDSDERIGRTAFANYMMKKYKCVYSLFKPKRINSFSNIVRNIPNNKWNKEVLILDVYRSSSKRKRIYNMVRMCRSIVLPQYESFTKDMRDTDVICLSYFPPNLREMDKDKWIVYEIVNEKLVYQSYDYFVSKKGYHTDKWLINWQRKLLEELWDNNRVFSSKSVVWIYSDESSKEQKRYISKYKAFIDKTNTLYLDYCKFRGWTSFSSKILRAKARGWTGDRIIFNIGCDMNERDEENIYEYISVCKSGTCLFKEDYTDGTNIIFGTEPKLLVFGNSSPDASVITDDWKIYEIVNNNLVYRC